MVRGSRFLSNVLRLSQPGGLDPPLHFDDEMDKLRQTLGPGCSASAVCTLKGGIPVTLYAGPYH